MAGPILIPNAMLMPYSCCAQEESSAIEAIFFATPFLGGSVHHTQGREASELPSGVVFGFVNVIEGDSPVLGACRANQAVVVRAGQARGGGSARPWAEI